MSGPDRRAPGDPGSDGQTDPFLPRVIDPPPEEQTDPHLPRIRTEPAVPPSSADPDDSATTGGLAAVGHDIPDPPEQSQAVYWVDPQPGDLDPVPAEQRPTSWRRAQVLVPLGVLGLLLALYAVDLLLAGADVPRNTVVGGTQIGGLSREQAAAVLAERGVPALAAPRSATAGPVTLEVRPAEAGITLDVPGSVGAAAAQPLNPLTRVLSLFADRRVDAILDVDQPALNAAMSEYAERVDVEFVEGSIAFAGTTPSVVAPSDGRELDRAAATSALMAALRAGSAELTFPVREQRAQVTAAEAQQTLDSFVIPALAAPVRLTGGDGAETDLTVAEIAATLRFGAADDGSLSAWLDETGLVTAIGEDALLFVVPPVDATFDVSGAAVSVIPSVEGTAIDVAALAEDLMRTLLLPAPRTAAVPLTAATPGLRTDEARTLNIVSSVSMFTSSYDDAAVAQNIRIVAAKLDGAVVRPGETYSLNTGTGPRTAALGYVSAAAPGEGLPTVGEGISPLGTAMLNAVFFAGLEPVRHTPHSSYDGSYPAGRDASVRYDSTDLVWRNNSPNGVYVQIEWAPTEVTVSFWSSPLYVVEAVSTSQSNLRAPAAEVRSGVDCQTSSGSSGFDITITRVFRQLGTRQVLREDEFTTSYQPAPRVLCEGAPEPPPFTEPPPPVSITLPPSSSTSSSTPPPPPVPTSQPTTTRPTTSSPPTTATRTTTTTRPTTTSSPPTTTTRPTTTTTTTTTPTTTSIGTTSSSSSDPTVGPTTSPTAG